MPIHQKMIGPTVALMVLLCGCSVISSDIRSEAAPPVPYGTLLKTIDSHTGQTVILGGYILETVNLSDKTIVTVLHTPLGMGQEPGYRDKSEGRFSVSYEGFLDPEIYRGDRKVTVAGIVLGLDDNQIGEVSVPYVRLKNRQTHLWPEIEYNKQYPYSYYDPYPGYIYRHRPYYP
jgi:outer membrane lipoprotein